eukprot:2504883-Prymnesium_polylepis.1
MLRPCKRKNGEWGSKVPILFAEGDGMGSDTCAALWRMVQVDPGEPGTEHTTPLFRVGGKCLTASDGCASWGVRYLQSGRPERSHRRSRVPHRRRDRLGG